MNIMLMHRVISWYWLSSDGGTTLIGESTIGGFQQVVLPFSAPMLVQKSALLPGHLLVLQDSLAVHSTSANGDNL